VLSVTPTCWSWHRPPLRFDDLGHPEARFRRDNASHEPPKPDTAGLLARALNSTLSHLVKARARWGHAPASAIVLSAPVPIPACRKYKKPLTLAEALVARLEFAPERDPQFAQSMAHIPVSLLELWQQMFEANAVLQWTAGSYGASFLDVAPISMMRPDGARAHGDDLYDCLHSCYPGPVDTYARLLLGLVDDNHDVFLGGARPSPSRFFKGRLANQTAFLARGTGRSISTTATSTLELCTESPTCHERDDELATGAKVPLPYRACCAVSSEPNAPAEPWWPFREGGPVGSRALAD